MPKVSIIVPVYNGASYIERCLDSLGSQTLEDIEVIVVDDGSTDETWTLVEKWTKTDVRFARSVRAEHGGQSAARNRGLAEASGDFIAFVDSDDHVDPDYCRLPHELACESGADIVMFGFWWVYPDRRILHHPSGKAGMNPKKALLKATSVVWDKLYRRSFLKRCGLTFPAIHHEDEVFTPVMMAHAPSLAALNQPLYHYIKHEGSVTGLTIGKNSADQLKAFRMVIERSRDLPAFRHELEYYAVRSLRRSISAWQGCREGWAQACVLEARSLLEPLDHDRSENPYILRDHRTCWSQFLFRLSRTLRLSR